jgi:hypothetical protein
MVHWNAHGPDDNEIASLVSDTGIEVREYNFHESKLPLMIPAPQNLSLDRSKMIQKFIPPNHPRWLVVIIPFSSTEPEQLGELKAFKFADDYIETAE